jgi:hypothetical protein
MNGGKITASVDAAYALHQDSKSHMGVIVYEGGTLVYVTSKKQKCMSKSPTEAELTGLMNNLGLLVKKMKVPMVYQNCNAVVTLVTKGGGQMYTQHLQARMNPGKEMVDQVRIMLKVIKGEEMDMDDSSTPHNPIEHKKFAMKLLNTV